MLPVTNSARKGLNLSPFKSLLLHKSYIHFHVKVDWVIVLLETRVYTFMSKSYLNCI